MKDGTAFGFLLLRCQRQHVLQRAIMPLTLELNDFGTERLSPWKCWMSPNELISLATMPSVTNQIPAL